MVMAKPNAKTAKTIALTTVSSSLWLAVLVPILGVSAYSFYWISRHWGVPPIYAIAMSTCFDGVTLLAAEYSLRYAQEGMSGTLPRTVVRLFALIAAYLQAFHARLGHEPTGGMVLWASLPVGAVVVYEIHIRWERRKALARVGVQYPAPLPSFGIVTWLLFPLATLTTLREIVGKRKNAIALSVAQRTTVSTVKAHAANENSNPKPNVKTSTDNVVSISQGNGPKKHQRSWLQEHGYKVSDRARIAGSLLNIHDRECAECNPGPDQEEAAP